ncbi:MAG: NAD(P)H-quinone oxidoreductase [Pseudomonadota bacterium]
MRFIDISEHGGPDVLKPAARATPTVRKGDVLIKVAAAGVNRPDISQRVGKYPPPPDASDIPGLEVSGVIVDVDDAVTTFKVGDRVCALTPGGGYAEYCLAPAEQCLPIPKGLSMLEAAGLPETFFTVWRNVFDLGGLKEGERFLVHGGASGIGVAAIQMARAMGAVPFATAGSDEKCRACEELGAQRCFNYRTEDFVAEIGNDADYKEIDVILDMVGGEYVARNLSVLARGGRHVSIAAMTGANVSFNIWPVLFKNLTLTGSTLRPVPIEGKLAIATALREKIWPKIETGEIRPVIHRSFGLDEAAAAHTALEASKHIGKIMLVVDP